MWYQKSNTHSHLVSREHGTMQSFSISYSIQSDGGGTFSVFATKLLLNNLDMFESPPQQIHYQSLARRIRRDKKKARSQVARVDFRHRNLTPMVSGGLIIGVERSYGRRRER